MNLRAVIFDLGGVVLGSPVAAIRAYESDCGLAAGSLAGLIGYGGPEGAWQRLERGELTMTRFYEAFDAQASRAGLRISTAGLMERMAAIAQPRAPMVTAIRKLREHGLATAALTNNWLSDDQNGKMDLLRPEFDVFIESARVGLRKPDKRIYEMVCEQLGVEPAQSVFLDDIGGNLKPAKEMGMLTIKVADPIAALQELERALGLSLVSAD